MRRADQFLEENGHFVLGVLAEDVGKELHPAAHDLHRRRHLFTLLPLVFTFDRNGAEFLIPGRHPGLVWSFWSLAVAPWTAAYVMARSVRQLGP